MVMRCVAVLIARAQQRDTGASATEYALLVAGVALIIVAGVAVFGNVLGAAYDAFSSQVGGF